LSPLNHLQTHCQPLGRGYHTIIARTFILTQFDDKMKENIKKKKPFPMYSFTNRFDVNKLISTFNKCLENFASFNHLRTHGQPLRCWYHTFNARTSIL